MNIKKQRSVSLSILILICFGSILFIVVNSNWSSWQEQCVCTITVHGDLFQCLPLSENQTIRVETDGGYNTIQIQNGMVSVIEADCANQICVQSGQITKHSQMISCIPHGLIITITNETEQEVDSIAY